MMKFSNDLGNSSIKATINGEHYEIPSVVSQVREFDITDPIEFNNEASKAAYISNLFDNLDITVSSSAISMQGRYYFGNAAVKNSNNLLGFDINDYGGKSESDISVILTLGFIAGKRVIEAYNDGEDLSETLKTDVVMTTALPISEARVPGTRDKYRNRFIGRSHTVTINNFVDPITVKINFSKVYVGFEGEMAHLYIQNADNELKKGVFADFKKHYPEDAKSITVDDLISAPNAMTLDFGSQTLDIATIVNGKTLLSASLSANNGFGYALEDSVRVLQSKKMFFENRFKLQEYLNSDQGALGQKRKSRVEQVVRDQISPLVPQNVATVSKAVNLAGANIQVVFALGGGSIPMEKYSDLRDQLSKKLAQFTGGDDIYVIFIPSEAAPYCNERGLELMNEYLSSNK